MQDEMLPKILALVYSDGLAADRILAELGYSLRSAGIVVAGLVQLNTFERNPEKCDMIVEELHSSTKLQLSENRGRQASGCRLDRAALAQAAGLLAGAVAEQPDLLIVNKFGKVEAEGGGLRDVIALAIAHGVPTLVGVPFRNLDQWRHFAGDLAAECPIVSANVPQWLRQQGILPTDGRSDFRADVTAGAS